MNIKASENPISTNNQNLILGIITLGLSVLLSIAIISSLTQRVVNETTLFDTDEASHALPALELYTAAQRLDIIHFIKGVGRQNFYPPIHSLTAVLPAYLIAGPSLVTTRMSTVITFALLLIVLAIFVFRATTQITGKANSTVYIATAFTLFFVSTSPVLIQNAVLSMLELIGCLWTTLLIGLCWHLEHSSYKQWLHVCLLAFILLLISLTKYSFAAMVIPATIMAILTDAQIRTKKKTLLREAGVVLFVLTLILGSWFLAVGLQGIINFAFNQPQYAPLLSSENLFYYPRTWINQFHLHPILGIITFLLACWGAIKGWNLFAVRTASWIVFFGLLTLIISLNNQARHIIIVTPGIWFLAAIGLTQLLTQLEKVNRSPFVISIPLIVIIAFMSLSVLQRAEELQPALTYSFEGKDTERIQAMNTYLFDNVDFEKKVLILGLFDQFSTGTISWQIASINGIAPSEVPAEDSIPSAFIPPPSTDDTNEDSPAITALNTAATAGYYHQIVVVYGKNLTIPYVVAAPNALREFEPISKEFKDYRIDIFNFE